MVAADGCTGPSMFTGKHRTKQQVVEIKTRRTHGSSPRSTMRPTTNRFLSTNLDTKVLLIWKYYLFFFFLNISTSCSLFIHVRLDLYSFTRLYGAWISAELLLFLIKSTFWGRPTHNFSQNAQKHSKCQNRIPSGQSLNETLDWFGFLSLSFVVKLLHIIDYSFNSCWRIRTFHSDSSFFLHLTLIFVWFLHRNSFTRKKQNKKKTVFEFTDE